MRQTSENGDPIVCMTQVEIAELARDVAQRVEDKLLAKAARWLVLNAVGVIIAAAAGIAAFYGLDARIASNNVRDDSQDARLSSIANEAALTRSSIDFQLRSISERINEINTFLRDQASKDRK